MGGKRYQKGENFSEKIKRSPGSTRAAAGVCVITFSTPSLHSLIIRNGIVSVCVLNS